MTSFSYVALESTCSVLQCLFLLLGAFCRVANFESLLNSGEYADVVLMVGSEGAAMPAVKVLY